MVQKFVWPCRLLWTNNSTSSSLCDQKQYNVYHVLRSCWPTLLLNSPPLVTRNWKYFRHSWCGTILWRTRLQSMDSVYEYLGPWGPYRTCRIRWYLSRNIRFACSRWVEETLEVLVKVLPGSEYLVGSRETHYNPGNSGVRTLLYRSALLTVLSILKYKHLSLLFSEWWESLPRYWVSYSRVQWEQIESD